MKAAIFSIVISFSISGAACASTIESTNAFTDQTRALSGCLGALKDCYDGDQFACETYEMFCQRRR